MPCTNYMKDLEIRYKHTNVQHKQGEIPGGVPLTGKHMTFDNIQGNTRTTSHTTGVGLLLHHCPQGVWVHLHHQAGVVALLRLPLRLLHWGLRVHITMRQGCCRRAQGARCAAPKGDPATTTPPTPSGGRGG
jgi:hypothetical protein